MILHSVETCAPDTGLGCSFDAAIFASGFESRCVDLAYHLYRKGCLDEADILLLRFIENSQEAQRLKNDRILEPIASKPLDVSENDGELVERACRELIEGLKTEGGVIRVFVDISSMSRPWYAGIVLALRKLRVDRRIEVTFGYRVGKFQKASKNYPPSEIVCPVSGFSSAESPERPTALVLALGYDPGRGLGLKEYLDPELTLGLLSKNRIDERYIEAVENANRDLLDLIKANEVFWYDIQDPAGTFYTLRSLCSGLANEWRVVLASVGPKLMGLNFFLLGSVDSRLSVWRASGGKRVKPKNVVGEFSVSMRSYWIAE